MMTKNYKKHHEKVARIVTYLNKKAKKRISFRSKTNSRLILKRLSEGYEFEDFKKVIDLKVKAWIKVPEMKSYLKPTTLFADHNFRNYLLEAHDSKNDKKVEYITK